MILIWAYTQCFNGASAKSAEDGKKRPRKEYSLTMNVYTLKIYKTKSGLEGWLFCNGKPVERLPDLISLGGYHFFRKKRQDLIEHAKKVAREHREMPRVRQPDEIVGLDLGE
jgi:hypothetical protein